MGGISFTGLRLPWLLFYLPVASKGIEKEPSVTNGYFF